MKRILLFTLAVLAMVTTGRAQTNNTSAQELMKLESDWKQAVVNRDSVFLNRLYADDFLGTDGEGLVWTKKEDIEIDTTGMFKLEAFQLGDLKARTYGDTGIVTGRNTLKGSENGNKLIRGFRFTDVFVRREGRWQLVASHMTPIDALVF